MADLEKGRTGAVAAGTGETGEPAGPVVAR